MNPGGPDFGNKYIYKHKYLVFCHNIHHRIENKEIRIQKNQRRINLSFWSLPKEQCSRESHYKVKFIDKYLEEETKCLPGGPGRVYPGGPGGPLLIKTQYFVC